MRIVKQASTAISGGPAAPETLAERLRLALDFSDTGEWTWEAASGSVRLSVVASQIFGVPPETAMTWSAMQEQILHPADAPAAADAVRQAIAHRTAYKIEYRVRRPSDRHVAWVLVQGKAYYDEAGAVLGMLGLIQDITGRKLEQLAVAEEAQALEVLNRSAALLTSELDIEKIVQAVTDAGVEITGAQFGAFFYTTSGENGEPRTLCTLSGVTRAAVSQLSMLRDAPAFAPTFSGEEIVRCDDITAHPRYGQLNSHLKPYHGIPPGHLPVRSYMEIPVMSRAGGTSGRLLFGHADAGVFDERDERMLAGIASQATVAIDNSRLFQRVQQELQQREMAEEALRSLAAALDQRVQERTLELATANVQLKQEVEERERVQEALRHAQKLEAVGQLTGGVAHDFNNLLTIVTGNLDTLARRLGDDADIRIRRPLEHALEGSRRAAVLTQRLLAFARRQPLKPEPADPNRLVRGMSELLHRTLGERIEIETVLSAGTWAVEVDIGELENAILNLAVNARDAMANGGKLTIETSNVYVDQAYCRTHEIAVGQYIVLCVSDTGGGIPPHLIDKVFEPFFTTKAVGHGTGLGLSQVYGFVKQSGGNVRVYSELGEGTTVKIYLPRFMGDASTAAKTEQALLPGEPEETVLVVEDDEGVRQLSVSLFEELGYRVIEAADGYTALELLDGTPRVDLLFTDVGLPKMNGRQLAEEAARRRPGLKVLFTTGYARNAIVHQGRLDAGVDLICKPFTFADLSEKVRAILDRRG